MSTNQSEEAPKRISDRVLHLNIDGYLMPVDVRGQPILLEIPGTPDRFISIFSTEVKLDAMFETYGLSYSWIKQIQNGPEFLASLNENILSFHLRVAIDPYKHENGRVRFVEVPLPEVLL